MNRFLSACLLMLALLAVICLPALAQPTETAGLSETVAGVVESSPSPALEASVSPAVELSPTATVASVAAASANVSFADAILVVIQILIVFSSLVMIVTVLMQSGQTQGLGAIAGGAETFFGKNKARSVEGKLATLTKISAGLFVVMALLMVILS